MIEIIDKKMCSGCTACMSACPNNCIDIKVDDEGFEYPYVNKEMCSNCQLCEKACAFSNPYDYTNYIGSYACKHKNEKIRKDSSSGGIFSALAEKCINDQGIVFGAYLNEKIECEHGFADRIEDYAVFRGSKYVQSKMGNTYHKVKEFLNQGKKVMFSGTPCQIAGLKHFLNYDYKNLLCVDFICHGVPSPKVFKLYIEELQEKHNHNIKTVRFRTKLKKWQNVSDIQITLFDGTTIIEKNSSFLSAFSINLYLRPSCHECKANNFRSKSDITIADYWGGETKFPIFTDDLGISIAILKSENGVNFFEEIKEQLDFKPAELGHAAKWQHNLIYSSKPNKLRSNFFEDLIVYNMNYPDLSKKYIISSWKQKIKKIFGHRFPYFIWNIICRKIKL